MQTSSCGFYRLNKVEIGYNDKEDQDTETTRADTAVAQTTMTTTATTTTTTTDNNILNLITQEDSLIPNYPVRTCGTVTVSWIWNLEIFFLALQA